MTLRLSSVFKDSYFASTRVFPALEKHKEFLEKGEKLSFELANPSLLAPELTYLINDFNQFLVCPIISEVADNSDGSLLINAQLNEPEFLKFEMNFWISFRKSEIAPVRIQKEITSNHLVLKKEVKRLFKKPSYTLTDALTLILTFLCRVSDFYDQHLVEEWSKLKP